MMKFVFIYPLVDTCPTSVLSPRFSTVPSMHSNILFLTFFFFSLKSLYARPFDVQGLSAFNTHAFFLCPDTNLSNQKPTEALIYYGETTPRFSSKLNSYTNMFYNNYLFVVHETIVVRIANFFK